MGSRVPSKITNALALPVLVACRSVGARAAGTSMASATYRCAVATPDVKGSGQAGVGVAAAQVGQSRQSLTARTQPPPARSQLGAARCEVEGQQTQGRSGQVDRRTVDKHDEAPGRATGDLGREPVYQELHCYVEPPASTCTALRQVGKDSRACALRRNVAVKRTPKRLRAVACHLPEFSLRRYRCAPRPVLRPHSLAPPAHRRAITGRTPPLDAFDPAR